MGLNDTLFQNMKVTCFRKVSAINRSPTNDRQTVPRSVLGWSTFSVSRGTAWVGKVIHTIRLARAQVKIGLTNLTYNLMRYLQLTEGREGVSAAV